MKLKMYDFSKTKTNKVKEQKALITMSSTTGLCRLNKSAALLTCLSPANVIVVFNDSENPKDWFFRLANHNEVGIQLRVDKSSRNSIVFSSKNFVADIVKSFKWEGTSIKFEINNDPHFIEGLSYWKLIIVQN